LANPTIFSAGDFCGQQGSSCCRECQSEVVSLEQKIPASFC
jgi:hypothetical protein